MLIPHVWHGKLYIMREKCPKILDIAILVGTCFVPMRKTAHKSHMIFFENVKMKNVNGKC